MAHEDDQELMIDEDLDSFIPIDEHEEYVSQDGQRIRRRGVYLLPNLLTLGALFAGFYAIIAGMNGNFNAAGWAILIASVLDGLDGRVARMTNTQSAFGAQFDSLADMVSFGVAPALIVFSWALSSLGNAGWAASFVFMSCAALRLARFNVQLGTVDKRFFVGLQSPVAAGLVSFVVWVGYKYDVEPGFGIAALTGLLTVFAGLLMISNYRYYSFKEIHFKGTVPYVVFIMAVVLLAVIAQRPHEVLLTMCVVYAVSGPVIALYRIVGDRRRKAASAAATAVAGSAETEIAARSEAQEDAPENKASPKASLSAASLQPDALLKEATQVASPATTHDTSGAPISVDPDDKTATPPQQSSTATGDPKA